MLLFFLIFSFFLYPSSSKILVKEAKMSPITQGNVAMTFYIMVENVSNCTHSVSAKMTKCCEDISKKEKDCKFMNLIGGELGNVPPKVTQKFLLLYPNMYSHNRKGQCTISMKAVCLNDKKGVTLNTKINFNTYLRHLKNIKGLKKCKSRDLDPYQDCTPVDCTMKYLGTRNFFNSKRKRCQVVPTCLTNPGKELPDIVYVPRSNICRNLDKCIEPKDIKCLDTNKKNGSNKVPKSIPSNVRCHQGTLDHTSGFCRCKPGWTSVPMNKDLFEPSLFQFHMCNMRVSSWNDVNNKKIKLTLILIAVFGVIVSIFIILLSFILSIVYRCLNSDQQPITIFGDRTGTGSTSCTKRTTMSTSSCRSPRGLGSQPSLTKTITRSSKSVSSAQSKKSNPPEACKDKEMEAPCKSNSSTNSKTSCNIVDKEYLPQKKRKRKCKDSKAKECHSISEHLSSASSLTTEQKCENYLRTLQCKKNSNLTWSKYKWKLDEKMGSSSSPCTSQRSQSSNQLQKSFHKQKQKPCPKQKSCPKQKPCKRKPPKPKRKKCKCKYKTKKYPQCQIEKQTPKEKCETFLLNLKSKAYVSSSLSSSCSSSAKESTPCKSVDKNVCTSSTTSLVSQNKPSTSLYIVNEIKKDRVPTISLESAKKSSSRKQVHREENQNVLEIVNKLIQNATTKNYRYKSTDRNYCSEPPRSVSNTDITWGGSSFESKSATTYVQNIIKNKEMSNGKTCSTSAFGKHPNFHLMEMIELQMSSEETHAGDEIKSIGRNESSELKPIVETLNITRPQDFSTSDTSNFTPLPMEECGEVESIQIRTQKKPRRKRKVPFLHYKKYTKISTSSTSSSLQGVDQKNENSKRRKSKSISKDIQEIVPLCSQGRDIVSSSEDTENLIGSQKKTRFGGLKAKFRKYLCKTPDPTNTSSWTSVKETVSSVSHYKTPNDISTSHETTPAKIGNKVEESESQIEIPKPSNIPISSPLSKQSSSNFSPRPCKIPGPIFNRRSPKSSSPGPSSRFYVAIDNLEDQNTKNEPP